MQHSKDELNRGGEHVVAGGPRRRPYDCPRILSTERLEVLASTCDPAGGGKNSFGEPGCTNFTQS